MATSESLPNGTKITWRVKEFLDAVEKEALKRLWKATTEVKTRVQRNIAIPTRTQGPSKEGEYPHADTGLLRNSIYGIVYERDLIGRIGTTLQYGCVFGALTAIATERGTVPICQVKVGDKVLTQTGEFRTVLATPRYSALEKPELVTIITPWREDKDHELTLTSDHKVLVCRDGLNKWVPAGELEETDCLFMRKKLSWSQGTAKRKAVHCRQCGQKAALTNIEFCSIKCRALYWAKTGTNPHLGKKRSKATKAKQSARVRQRLLERPETHPNRVMAERGYMTVPEQMLAEWLTDRGLEFERQVAFGKSFADFYVSRERTIYEADGAFWHQDQTVDIARDKAILEHDPGVQILHVHFYNKRFSPKELDAKPLPGVYYVKCNPDTNSFADPRFFDLVTIKSLCRWNYAEAPMKEKGSKAAWLYDLTVEGVHSFVASGLVISNSWLEYGTAGGKVIYAKPGGVLSWVDPVSGKRRFAKKITLGAIRGRSFLRRTLNEMKPRLKEIFFAPWFKDKKGAASSAPLLTVAAG